MIEYKVGKNVFMVKNHLGVTNELKRAFGKEYQVLIESLEKLTLRELIKFVHTCIDLEGYEADLKEFTAWVENDSGMGVMDLYDMVGFINTEIQYPGKTPEERKKLMMDKIKERRELESI